MSPIAAGEETEKTRPMTDSKALNGNSGQIASSSGPSSENILADYRHVDNVKLTVLAELDRGTISMGELLNLQIGDILPFSRPVGENIDLFASDILIGNAEILAVNERLAVRIADVNKKLTSFQAKKNSLVNSNSGPVPKIRRLASSEL
jgi:flagellar motor switch/type III secretory pathway protein FliN